MCCDDDILCTCACDARCTKSFLFPPPEINKSEPPRCPEQQAGSPPALSFMVAHGTNHPPGQRGQARQSPAVTGFHTWPAAGASLLHHPSHPSSVVVSSGDPFSWDTGAPRSRGNQREQVQKGAQPAVPRPLQPPSPPPPCTAADVSVVLGISPSFECRSLLCYRSAG